VTRTPGDPGNERVAARRLAQALRDGHCPPDAAFDRFLPASLRDLSPQHWTPLPVVKRASEWLDSLGIRRVVDIGAGAGKFCVAGALFSGCRFIGLEHRPSRVESARTLARLFGVDDRVGFVSRSMTPRVTWTKRKRPYVAGPLTTNRPWPSPKRSFVVPLEERAS
jgi:hypothetical protein